MPNKDDILKEIAHMNDLSALGDIYRAAQERIKHVREANYQRKVAETWEWAKGLKPGQKLYVCASGVFLGGAFQRGDSMVVDSVRDSRRSDGRTLWVIRDGRGPKHKRRFWVGPEGIVLYDLREDPPENPVTLLERKMADQTAKIIAQATADEKKVL